MPWYDYQCGKCETVFEVQRPFGATGKVKCSKCGNEQIVFGNAVNRVNCNVCGNELAEPSGGKARIKGEIVAVFE